MATVKDWIEGARLRTLPASLSPVVLGTGAAYGLGSGSLPRALLAAAVALLLQIGTNFANDYSDGIRGTDKNRTGPARLTGGGIVKPKTVFLAAMGTFGLGGIFGLVLVAVSGAWWLTLGGVAAVAAAWFYTGGKHPYGYMGLGEVFVFIFFGLFATLATTITQAGRVDSAAWAVAVATGLISCAILMVNNLRDIPTDKVNGKNTVAVRLGDTGARVAYIALLVIGWTVGFLAALQHPLALLGVAVLPMLIMCIVPILEKAQGRALIPVLRNTGLTQLAYAILVSIGLAFG